MQKKIFNHIWGPRFPPITLLFQEDQEMHSLFLQLLLSLSCMLVPCLGNRFKTRPQKLFLT